MREKKYIILNYKKTKSIQKMLNLTDEQLQNVLSGKGYLTIERLSLGNDVLLRVGTYINEDDAENKFNFNMPLGSGITGLYEVIKKRHEYGLNDSEDNYFIKKTESEIKKSDDNASMRLYLIRTYKEYLRSTNSKNRRIQKNLALNELYICNAVNGKDIRGKYKAKTEELIH